MLRKRPYSELQEASDDRSKSMEETVIGATEDSAHIVETQSLKTFRAHDTLIKYRSMKHTMPQMSSLKLDPHMKTILSKLSLLRTVIYAWSRV